MARIERGAAYGLLCALATVSARAEYVYHDVVLSGALDGRHDVAFCFGVDADRIEQQWAYLPDRPGEICRIVSSQLCFRDEQITGSVTVEASVSESSDQDMETVNPPRARRPATLPVDHSEGSAGSSRSAMGVT